MILLLLLVCSPLAVCLGVKQRFSEETGYSKGWAQLDSSTPLLLAG